MYLNGKLLEKDQKTLKSLVGKIVTVLVKNDIDKSGRGYYFPRVRKVTDVTGRAVEFDGNQDYINFRDIQEIVEGPNG